MATLHLVGAHTVPTPRVDEDFDERTTFAEWFRRTREARGLTLDGLTRQTRIPRRHLEAIEGGSLTWLPEFYQRAEVRAFARAVGVDEQLALSRLQMAIRPVEAPAAVAPPSPPPQPARRFSAMYVWLALGAVVLASSLVAWVLFDRPLTDRSPTGGDVAGPRGTTPSQPALQTLPDPASQSPEVPSDYPLTPGNETALAPAPATTVLVVTTQPPGARVTVNGVGWGVSPIVIRHLPPGNKRIRVSKDGYAAAERMLALDEGQPRAVTIRLLTAP